MVIVDSIWVGGVAPLQFSMMPHRPHLIWMTNLVIDNIKSSPMNICLPGSEGVFFLTERVPHTN